MKEKYKLPKSKGPKGLRKYMSSHPGKNQLPVKLEEET
jgi:hypothetical protein